MKRAFTMLELILVLFIIGIITGGFLLPKFVNISHYARESILKGFVLSLNRTTGEDLWARSMAQGKNGSITDLAPVEDAKFLSQYIDIPKEINKSSIDLKKCGKGEYKTVMQADPEIMGEEYNITCKDGTQQSAPYFRLIRLRDNKILVTRD